LFGGRWVVGLFCNRGLPRREDSERSRREGSATRRVGEEGPVYDRYGPREVDPSGQGAKRTGELSVSTKKKNVERVKSNKQGGRF